MKLVAGYSDYAGEYTDGELDYVLYRFVLDAAEVIFDSSQTSEIAVDLAKLLKQRAYGVWRSEEHDSVVLAQFRSLAEAAEALLTANGFDIEWIDGYTIYCKEV